MSTTRDALPRKQHVTVQHTHLHIPLMQRASDDQHNVVDHMAVSAKVQEFGQCLVCLQHNGMKHTLLN